MAKWLLKKNAGNIKLLSEQLHIKEITAQALINRNIRTINDAKLYLNPSQDYLCDINKMHGVMEAYRIINNSILKNEKIVIYGDYDVDGVMSCVILFKALKAFNADVSYYIPQREEEGYGLNIEAVKRIHMQKTDIIITCDNGISGFNEIKYAKELGMKVIVIDHHEPGFVEDAVGSRVDVVPEADAIIDPKQSICMYPFKMMCAAGICYRFVLGLFEFCNKSIDFKDELLIFACIATFCDIVDLHGENRIIAKNGLNIINTKVENIGLSALINERGLKGKTIGSFELGFIIGPCINATGRLESASIAVELFLTCDETKACLLAKKLHELNEERKKMTQEAVDTIMQELQQSSYTSDKVIVVYNKEIHESIAGIVAGRIKDKLFRPCIVLTKSGDLAKGSARSIEAYNIFEALYSCRHLFERFGGHSMAAGLSIKEENIETLRMLLNQNAELTEEDFTEIIRIDAALDLDDVTYELAKELQILEPFGKENKEPLFGVKSVLITELRVISEKNTMIMTFSIGETYRKMKGVCFGKVDYFIESLNQFYDEYTINKILNGVLRTANLKLDLIYSVEINEYNGNISVQIRIKDFRIVGDK